VALRDAPARFLMELAKCIRVARIRKQPRWSCWSNQGEIHGDAIEIPLVYEDDAEAEDIMMGPVEARFLGHRMLAAPFALEGAVADQIQETILRWWQSL
jgi:hypothetical protein